ncbi:hypothetical protein EUX98_g4214 [Antrodiella citrinella]|uniref:Fungal-type protein kinase domain-containing protein n=1 Tax=Antrodiella citrinella TaxID=2447956 RepID=A0A4S4MUQ6_9APHY|nr:hypothetical protein EUX98_g4214 [Antrodiella citrinella]
MQTMPESIPELSHDDFKNVVQIQTPGTDSDVVARVLADLHSNGLIVGGRWKYWSQDPLDMKGDEDTVFKDMAYLSNAILDSGKKVMGKQPITQFLYRLRHVKKSDAENGGFKTDGTLFLLELTGLGARGDDRYTVDSVTNHEYKKLATPVKVNKNRRQVLGNATHMMYADPAQE